MRTSSVTVIRRDKEIDIAVGDTRIVILIHLHQGREFLWPVLRQRPSDSSATGILSEWPENNFPSLCFDERAQLCELLWPCWCSQLFSLWFTRSCSSFQKSSRSTTRRSKLPSTFVKRCVLKTKRIIHWAAFVFLSLQGHSCGLQRGLSPRTGLLAHVCWGRPADAAAAVYCPRALTLKHGTSWKRV